MLLSKSTTDQIRKEAGKSYGRSGSKITFAENAYIRGAEKYAHLAEKAAHEKEGLVKALEWYQERAESLVRYMIAKNDNSTLAVIKELELDAGSRATAALTAYQTTNKVK